MGATAAQINTVRPNLVLGICCLSLLLVGMDVTIVNVALPAIAVSLGLRFRVCSGWWMHMRWWWRAA